MYQVSTSLATGATEPITLTQLKNWLKIHADITEDDDLITSMITECREWAETYTGQTLIAKNVVEKFDSFGTCLQLFASPVRSITSIQYYDSDNTQQTLSAENYSLISGLQNAEIYPAVDQTFPGVAVRPDAITVTYVAGFESVPGEIITAMRHILAKTYEKREDPVHQLKTAAEHYLDRSIRFHL